MSARSRRRPPRREEDPPASKTPSVASKTEHDATDPKAQRPASSFIRFALTLAAIGAAAFFLRLVHVFQTASVPSAMHLMGDAKGYFDWAERIADGAWYGDETFYQAPLYPYFLAVVMSVCGKSIVAIRVIQAVLGAVAVTLLGLATARRFGRPAGTVAALGMAILPASIYYDGLIQKAALASFLLCVFLFAIATWGVTADPSTGKSQSSFPSLANVFAAGLSLALLVLVRENTLLWTPLPFVWLWLHRLRNPEQSNVEAITIRRRITTSCVYIAALACILLPVAARNASLGGEWSPTTFQAGPNFYIGNHRDANGLYLPLVPGHETPLHERSDAVKLAQQESGKELTAREVSKFWFTKAFDDIRSDPSRWLQLMAIKCVMVVNYFEVPDVESMSVYRDASIVLLMFDRIWHFGVLCVLASLGIVLTRPNWRAHWLWYALMASLILATVGFFILGRYRFPLVPLLVPLASVGVVRTVTLLREREFRRLTVPLIVAVLVAAFCHLPIHDTNRLNASSIANVGAAAASRGDMELGIRLFRRAIQEEPEMPEAHLNLGRALFRQGDVGAAISEFQIAQTLEPNLVDVDYFLATALERVGDLQAAMFHYQRALAMDPGNQRVRESIARLQSVDGNR